MSFDIEHQLGRGEMEDAKPPDSSSEAHRGCWSSVWPTLGKAALGFCMVVGVVIFVLPFGAAAMALVLSLCAPLLALSGALFAVCVALIVGFPVILPLSFIIAFSLPKKTLTRLMRDDKEKQAKEADLAGGAGMGGLYDRARRKEPLWDRIMLGSFGVIARASLAALVWLALSFLVPRLKEVKILGSPMWKWSLLGVTLTGGYFESLTLSAPVLFLLNGTASYFAEELLFSVNHMAYFALVLGAWLGYFRTHHGLNSPHHSDPRAFEYVTWTFVSLFVGSILLLFKNLLLVKWSVDAIYRRFEPRILITSLKYYYIGVLAAGFNEGGILHGLKLVDELNQEGDDRLASTTVSKYVMSRKMSLSHLGYVSRILVSLGETMSPLIDREGDQEEVVAWFKKQIQNDTSDMCTPDGLLKLFRSPEENKAPELASSSPKGDAKLPESPTSSPKGEFEQPNPAKGDTVEPPESAKGDTVEPAELPTPSSLKGDVVEPPKLPFWKRAWKTFMVDVLDEEDSEVKAGKKSEKILEKNKKLANVLWRLVSEECSSVHTFTFDSLKIWMVDAHKDCINMGRTLADAKAIVTRLDIFMSFVIFVIVLLLWLLITGVSSTTVLVTVATPFLALTFIFGDSAKTFFQGLIFCFATHPFDVGDRCILDEVELEVKSVSILTTTFIKIGSKEKRLYPNSVLATKAIVNLGWQPDPKDMVELPLDPSTNLDDLKIKITEFFEEESKRYGNTYTLMISEVGENIKVKIHFSHMLTVHDLSHSQCFKKKNSQRSDFLSVIKKYVNESRIERMNSINPSQSTASTTTKEIIELTNQQK